MRDTLTRLFRYKAWADEQLLGALARFEPRGPVTPLAVKALSHTYVVDRIFAAHLRRTTHGYSSANLSTMPALEDLALDIRRSDREYLDYVNAIGPEQSREQIDFTFTDGTAGRMSREEMLLHVITHGIGHRGQISAVMLLNGMPPVSDGFATYLHEAKATTRRRGDALVC